MKLINSLKFSMLATVFHANLETSVLRAEYHAFVFSFEGNRRNKTITLFYVVEFIKTKSC